MLCVCSENIFDLFTDPTSPCIQVMCLWSVHMCALVCLCVSVSICVSVHTNAQRVRVLMCACVCVHGFCQPRGQFLSLARRCSHHWTDGQHPPSSLPHPFIYSSFSPSISVLLSCSPQTPHHLNLSFPTSQHPSIALSHLASSIINQSGKELFTFHSNHRQLYLFCTHLKCSDNKTVNSLIEPSQVF